MAQDRNMILVTSDSLRADHCGFHNSDIDLTPRMDRLVPELDAILYDNAISTGPRTPISVPESLTGEFIPTSESNDYKTTLKRISEHISTHKTIPELLSDRGYSTAAYTSNPYTTLTPGICA